MAEEKSFEMRFNQILLEEMGKVFELNPLPLDPDLKIKYSDSDKGKLARKLACRKYYLKRKYLGKETTLVSDC